MGVSELEQVRRTSAQSRGNADEGRVETQPLARDRAAGSAFTAFSDVRGSQAKSTAVDLVGHDALLHGFSQRLIQPLQKRRDALIVAAHESGEQSLIARVGCPGCLDLPKGS